MNFFYKLRIIGNELKNEISKDTELTGISGMILCFLGSNDEIYAKDLYNEFRVKRSTMTSILNNLEKKEYIKRVNVKEDARLKKIVLLEKGVSEISSFIEKRDGLEKKLVHNFTDKEMEDLNYLLDKMIDNMEVKNV